MLGQAVILKYTPRIKFQINDAIAEGDRVLTLLDELEKNEEDTQ
jgi:ribosome-binding factor A|tara:strand:+ start:393 stop:524 length:132 start_codon:yes stop_codon:yes gene_type:complete